MAKPTTEATLVWTAHHEAAHVVVNMHYGIEIKEVVLFADGDGNCEVPPDASYDRLVGVLAGQEADKLLLGNDPGALTQRRTGWAGDEEKAAEIALLIGATDCDLQRARGDAARLVNECWPIVCGLATYFIDQLREGDGFVRRVDLCGKVVMQVVERLAKQGPG